MKTKTSLWSRRSAAEAGSVPPRRDGGCRNGARARRGLWALAMLGLVTLRASAQLTVDTVFTNGLFEPYGVAVDSENVVYVTDSANHTVLQYDPNTGITSTLAGIPGESGSDDGPSYLAHLNSPQGLVLANVGGVSGLIIGDTGNHLIRFVKLANGEVSTLAGTAGGAGNLDAAVGTNATFRFPIGLALDSAGILYIADSKNNLIRQINLTDPNFEVTTLAVSGTTFREPNDLTVQSPKPAVTNFVLTNIVCGFTNVAILTNVVSLINTEESVTNVVLTNLVCGLTNVVSLSNIVSLTNTGESVTNVQISNLECGLTNAVSLTNVVGVLNTVGSVTNVELTNLECGLTNAVSLTNVVSLTSTVDSVTNVQVFNLECGLTNEVSLTNVVSLTSTVDSVTNLVLASLVDSVTNVVSFPNDNVLGIASDIVGGVTNISITNLVCGVTNVVSLTNVLTFTSTVDSVTNVQLANLECGVTNVVSLTNVLGLTSTVASVTNVEIANLECGVTNVVSRTNVLSFTSTVASITNVVLTNLQCGVPNVVSRTNVLSFTSTVNSVTNVQVTHLVCGLTNVVTLTNILSFTSTVNSVTNVQVTHLVCGLTNVVSLTNVLSLTSTVNSLTNALIAHLVGSVTNVVSLTNIVGRVSFINDQLWVADTRNHAIKLITRTGPTSATLTTVIGSNDQSLSGSKDSPFGANARFNNPRGILWLGAAGLVIADTGNQTIRHATNNPVISATNYGVVTFAGTVGQSGFVNGLALAAKFSGPHGLARDTLGNGFMIADLANNAIRRIQTGPTQPPVATPQIGWVDFVKDSFGELLSVLQTDQPFVFNNDVTIAALSEAGTETFFTYGPTPPSPVEDTIPSPSHLNGSTPPPYHEGMRPSEVPDSMVPPQSDLTIKVISTQDGRQSSPVVQARFQFKTANPVVNGNNAAQFTVSDLTANAQMWYTLDGTDPTNASPSRGPISDGTTLSLNIITNTVFKVRAYRDSYQISSVVSTQFSPTNYVANTVSFGFASDEASSDFVCSPGQCFISPVTLTLLPGAVMYSLQFNVTTTNLTAPAITPGAFRFESMLMKPIPNVTPVVYEHIPPAMFVTESVPNPVYLDGSTNFSSLLFTNAAENLLGVGWIERAGATNLYDTTKQDVITYSQAHDALFLSSAGKVILGGFSFTIATNAVSGQKYQIQLGRPSATLDGIGMPGSDVYIATPTNGSLGGGTINSIKHLTVGQRKYVVGDVAPFRWFNAGDFGNTNLLSSDVVQVFQSAIYHGNTPPSATDFFDGMDSCGGTYVDRGHGYLEFNSYISGPGARNPLFDGNDTSINQIAFGDGQLDVCDVYVTFRRSLDPSLKWFRRFWTNGIRGAEIVGNPPPPPSNSVAGAASAVAVKFATADVLASAGQTLQIPITAKVAGAYPLRTLMLNLSVNALDGSPALTSAVQFASNPALGSPGLSDSKGTGNYAATWLDSTIPGLTGDVTLGTLTIQVPSNATSTAAYAIHFDHASASPNGLASFPKQTQTGLITLSDRSTPGNDGIPDSWRLRYFGTVNNVLSQAGADADGDGANNLQEFQAGTDPNDANSVLRLKSNAGQPQECVVHWPSVAGKQYVIERAVSLYSPVWMPISTNSGTGSDLEFRDASGGMDARFYRVRVLQ